MKKLLSKVILYSFVLLALPYLYFLWQAKQAVDTFLLAHNFGGEIEYKWIFVGLEGQITLAQVSMSSDGRDPLFEAEYLQIYPTSIFDLVNASEHILHNEFPLEISVAINNASSVLSAKIPSYFGLNYQPEELSLFFPSVCATALQNDIPLLRFNGKSTFQIHRTADISEVSFEFESHQFANINGTLRVNNFSEATSDGSFISDLSLSFSNLTWLQQNTQRCLSDQKLNKESFTSKLSEQLILSAIDKKLVLEAGVAEAIADFLFVPQTIQTSFDIEEGKKFSQIPFKPFYELPEKLGLSLFLNDKPINVIFNQSKSAELSKELSAEEVVNKEPIDMKSRDVPIINREIKNYELKQYLGSKLLISLKTGKKVEGYLDDVERHSLRLVQRKFKGKTTISFEFKDIKKVTLIREEN